MPGDTETSKVLRRIGANVQRLRIERGLTQSGLAEKADLEPRSISRIEHASMAPTISTLVRIARALQVPIGRFFRPAVLIPTRRGRPRKTRSR